MTEKLYYADSHLKEFNAVVISCEPGKSEYRVVLDQTAFFPEGGGQYADTGTLVLQDTASGQPDLAAGAVPCKEDGQDLSGRAVYVSDVQEEDGAIYHMTDRPLPEGASVHGKIDWEKRFESMQQHTGEHIISGLVHGRFGYNNVGFHLGADYCTMDFDGPITKEALKEIELEANKIIYQNLDVKVLYPSKSELADMEYRSKIEIEGQVRIVNIPGVDTCACCAPHVKKTGEIGNLKLVDMVNYKGGERIYMLCGFRALSDHRQKEESAKAISALLCAKEEEIADAVGHLKEENLSLKGKVAELQQKLLAYRAQEINISGDVTLVFDGGLSGNAPRELMNLILKREARVCAVFAGNDEEGYRYVIGSHAEDVRPLCKKLNEAFSGRGGGKPEMVQGSLKGTEEGIRKLILTV